MNEIELKLQEFAKGEALKYLIGLPKFKHYIEKLSFILVGSAATGLCSLDSDVDIAIICDKEIYDIISKETRWGEGRPTEEIIDGIQLHYYATTFDLIEEKFKEQDDTYLYVYSNCIILQDTNNKFRERIESKNSKLESIRRQRTEGKLDMLKRRSQVLKYCIENNIDILVTTETFFEVIKLTLKVTALLDNIDFEPRKRLFNTALSGITGDIVRDKVRKLFHTMGLIGFAKEQKEFPQELNEISDILSLMAEEQGFRIGLEKPDVRHIER